MLSKYERRLVSKLNRSGRFTRHPQVGASFKFLIRPVTTVGVQKGKTVTSFEDEMFNTIKGMKLESPISGIVVSPIIFDGSIAKPPADQVKYMSSEKSVVCCIAIDYSLWTLASLPERLNLLADNVRDAITRIPRRYLCSEDLSKLRAVVDQVQSRLLTHITQSLK